MITNEIGLTDTPCPGYSSDAVVYLRGTEVAVVLDTAEVSREGLPDDKEIFVRLLTSTGIGWILVDYVEKVS